jgi:hypothetical protein
VPHKNRAGDPHKNRAGDPHKNRAGDPHKNRAGDPHKNRAGDHLRLAMTKTNYLCANFRLKIGKVNRDIRLQTKKSLRVVVDVEDVILRAGFDTEVIEQAENLGTMVGAVIDDMQQYLPQDEVLIFAFWEGFL